MNKLGPRDLSRLVGMAEAVTKRLDGEWSVDFLKDRHGKRWFIYMAEGALSYRNEDDFVAVSGMHEIDSNPSF